MLEDVGLRALGSAHLDQQFAPPLQRLIEFMDVELACILLSAGDRLVVHTAVGPWGRLRPDWEVPIGQGIAGRIMVRGEAMELHAPVTGEAAVSAALRAAGLTSLLGVPLHGRTGAIGVLITASVHDHPFADAERHFLSVVAERTALYLENALLHARLSASEARYRELVESASDVVVEADGEARIIFVNQACRQLLGYTPEEMIGQRLTSVLDPEDRREVSRGLQELLASGQTWDWEQTVHHRDGRRLHLSLKGYVKRGPAGEALGLVAFARDVTAQRNLEEQLRSSQRLEAIGRVAGGIAHDFSNLLTGILGSAHFLCGQVHCSHPFSGDLNLIITAAERASALTRQLLTFSRRRAMDLALVTLNGVVQEMLPLVHRTIEEQVVITVRLDPGLPPILGDTVLLEQVLLNLCVNARDAMPKGGELTIATGVAEVTAEQVRAWPGARPGRYALLTVGDNGMGMDEETRARVFEPYFSTKAESGHGTGLGLSTAHGIVSQHRGLIEVDSEPGRGTRFRIFLPLADAGVAFLPPLPAPPERAPAAGEMVLVAEDEAPVREILTRVLQRDGYRVVTAADGREAIDRFNEQPEVYDLVILDAVMPRVNGAEAMLAMRTVRPDVPVLFISGYAEEALSASAQGGGPARFMSKPFLPSEFSYKAMATLMEQRGSRGRC